MKKQLLLLFALVSLTLTGNAQNLLINGDFEAGSTLEPWWVFVDINVAEVTVDSSEGSVNYTEITLEGSNTYDIQLIQQLSAAQIEELGNNIDSTYYLTFDAIVPEERNCNLFFGENGGTWTNLAAGVTFTFVPETSTYGTAILITEVWDNMKFGLEIGTSTVPVEFDNIVLSKEVPDILGTEEIQQIAYKVFPNPAPDVINIETETGAVINLYALTGNLIESKTAYDSTVQFDVHDLSQGLYFVKIQTNKGSVTEKVYIQ